MHSHMHVYMIESFFAGMVHFVYLGCPAHSDTAVVTCVSTDYSTPYMKYQSSLCRPEIIHGEETWLYRSLNFSEVHLTSKSLVNGNTAKNM